MNEEEREGGVWGLNLVEYANSTIYFPQSWLCTIIPEILLT